MTRLWHGLIAVLATFALVGQVALTIDRDGSVLNLVSYFTIESNILVLATCLLLVQRPDRGGTAFGIMRLGSLVAITVTGLVYAFLLAGNGSFSGIEWWYDKIFHYIVPVLTVVGFVAFKPRTCLDRRALWFLVFPVAWLGYTLVRAEVAEPVFAITTTETAAVPYGFLDIAEHGVPTVAVICLVMTAAFVGLGVGYIGLSQRQAAPRAESSGE